MSVGLLLVVAVVLVLLLAGIVLALSLMRRAEQSGELSTPAEPVGTPDEIERRERAHREAIESGERIPDVSPEMGKPGWGPHQEWRGPDVDKQRPV